MYRVVLDTNVLISAIHFGGAPRQLLIHAIEGTYLLFISEDILTELSGILAKKFRYPLPMIQEIQDALLTQCSVVVPTQTVSIIRNQPGDNHILECARTARADYLVTGDKQHLLLLEKFRNTRIVSPAAFLDILKKQQ